MVPHRSPTNTSRWLHSRRHPILTEVRQKFLRSSSSNAFSSDSLLFSLSQSILYWKKFLLIFATIMVPHRSPRNTSRREQSHPHPSATFPSNAFPSDSLLFQSFPKHRNWQKLLLILATIMAPHRNPTTGRSCFQSLWPSSNAFSSDSLRFQSLYRLPKCTSEDGPSSNAFSSHRSPTFQVDKNKPNYWQKLLEHSLRFQCV